MVQTMLHVCSTCLHLFCITGVLEFSIFHSLVQAGYFLSPIIKNFKIKLYSTIVVTNMQTAMNTL